MARRFITLDILLLLRIDTRQQEGKHELKNAYFAYNGIITERTKIDVGDYMLDGNPYVSVDTKFSIQELISDLCGQQHERFKRELERAVENNIQLYILVEDDGGWCDSKQTIWNKPVRSVDDLFHWKNPRLFIFRGGKQAYPKATRGSTLAKICKTMELKYHVKFRFCSKRKCGETIIKLLTGEIQ